MDRLSIKLIEVIIYKNIKICRQINKQFLFLSNKYFYEKYCFIYSKIEYNHELIKHISEVDDVDFIKFSNLKSIKFCDSFDKDIKNTIPDTVTHIYFGECFDKEIIDCLPKSVIDVCLEFMYRHKKPGNINIYLYK